MGPARARNLRFPKSIRAGLARPVEPAGQPGPTSTGDTPTYKPIRTIQATKYVCACYRTVRRQYGARIHQKFNRLTSTQLDQVSVAELPLWTFHETLN